MAATGHVHGGKTLSFFDLDVAVAAKQRLEEFASALSEMLKTFQETNQYWCDRMAAEARVEGDFASKLTEARSIPEAVTTCQEWGSQHLEMIAKDAKHLFDDTQKIMQTGARLNGWATKAP